MPGLSPKPVRSRERPRTFDTLRICAVEDCSTPLSRYNPATVCLQCADKAELAKAKKRPRKKGQGSTRSSER
jgi:hypothetical protein